eukprot:COSAG05_NODE_4506_length_1485_cov_1.512266_1_plen_400_part_10
MVSARHHLAVILALVVLPLVTVEGPGAMAVGWADCSGTAPDARSVQRAWRRLSMDSHPDKAGGSGEHFQDLTELRNVLKHPEQFQIFKLLRNMTTLTPFSQRKAGLRVEHGSAQVAQKCTDVLDRTTCFPYVKVTAELSLSSFLPIGARWTIALGAEGVSTIQYEGDETLGGGYDACCDFLQHSNCVLRPPPPPPPPPAADVSKASDHLPRSTDPNVNAPPVDTTATEQKLADCVAAGIIDEVQCIWLDKRYTAHDCPLGDVFTASVTRPLHVMKAGLWAATISIREAAAAEAAALSAKVSELQSQVQAAAGSGAEAAAAMMEQSEAQEARHKAELEASQAEVAQLKESLAEAQVESETVFDEMTTLDGQREAAAAEAVALSAKVSELQSQVQAAAGSGA